MLGSIVRKVNPSILIICTMVIFATNTFWQGSNPLFQNDSEELVLSMVTAGRYNFDIGNRYFGLGIMASVEENSYGGPYEFYAHPELYDNSISEYKSQIGLQGWVFYFLAAIGVPRPVSAFRLGCCLALAIVLSLISFELYKKYGLIFASVFYAVTTSSLWITNFAPNLYWVTFTWFIPMLLGLICLNNLNKRWWLYPLFFLAILVKSACGYEYITAVMLSSIMFLVVEWIVAIKKDKQKSKLLFRTILMIGIMSLLGFVVAISVHSFMRGDGNILTGFNTIYQEDVLRRTFGSAADFPEVFAPSLNASIFDVMLIYLTRSSGVFAFFLLITSTAILIYKQRIKRHPLNADFWLLVVSFLTCISWFVLGKSHSYIHTGMNYVMWYMGFIQVGSYIVVKFMLEYLLSDSGEPVLKHFSKKIRYEVSRDIWLFNISSK